jgi:hypothetical protein
MLELACCHCDRSESADISCLGVLQGRDILIHNGMENSMFAFVVQGPLDTSQAIKTLRLHGTYFFFAKANH